MKNSKLINPKFSFFFFSFFGIKRGTRMEFESDMIEIIYYLFLFKINCIIANEIATEFIYYLLLIKN